MYDQDSLDRLGFSRSMNVLTETAISYLPYGKPVVRDDVFIKSRQNTSQVFISQNDKIFKIEKNGVYDSQIGNIAAGFLDVASINKAIDAGAQVGSVIQSRSGDRYLVTRDGKRKAVKPSDITGFAFTMSDALLAKIPGSGSLSSPVLLKTPSDGTVYVLVGSEKRPLVSMSDLLSITGSNEPYIAVVGEAHAKLVATGNIIIGAGRLVKSPSDATVYVSNGYNELIPMSSFVPADDLGVLPGIRTISESILSKYEIQQNKRLSSYVSCRGGSYLGISGGMYNINIGGKTALELDESTCNVLKARGDVPRFINGPDGTIYERVGDVLHPISSMATYAALKRTGDVTIRASRVTVSHFKIGAIK